MAVQPSSVHDAAQVSYVGRELHWTGSWMGQAGMASQKE